MAFLRETISSAIRHVATVAVNAGGTGYAVDDILTAIAGTGTAATFRVTSVAAGVIDGIAIESSGAYTVAPTLVANAVTGGTGTGATLDLTTELERPSIMCMKAILDAITGSHISAVAVNAGGTGYAVDDEVMISGGTFTFQARARVVAEAAGVVTEVAITSGGVYSVLPGATGAATTGGTGTGLTIDLTTEAALWTFAGVDGRSTYFDGITSFEWIATGTNAAGIDPIMGMIHQDTTGGPKFGLRYFQTFNDVFDFDNQSNASEGTFLNPTDQGGPKICSSDDTITLFMNYNARVINFVQDVAPSFELGMLGLHIPITDAPATTFPYPALALGTTRANAISIGSAIDQTQDGGHSSFLHPQDDDGGSLGGLDDPPYNFNTQIGLPARGARVSTPEARIRLWPTGVEGDGAAAWQNDTLAPSVAGAPMIPTLESTFGGSIAFLDSDWWNSTTDTSGAGQGQTPFPNLNGDGLLTSELAECILVDDSPGSVSLFGLLDGVRVLHGRGLNARDRVVDNDGNNWLVFTDTNTGLESKFFALGEF